MEHESKPHKDKNDTLKLEVLKNGALNEASSVLEDLIL